MALEGEEVVIARHGTPVAMLAPIRAKRKKRVLGLGRGTATILSDDWDKPMTEEEADAFWAGRW